MGILKKVALPPVHTRRVACLAPDGSSVMIYSFYIFGRGRKCLSYAEWNRSTPSHDVAAETKLLGGLLLTLKSFTQQIGPPRTQGFLAYVTPHYKLHSFDTASGYRFVLTTDPTGDVERHVR